jgi:hypothetical protein
MSPDMGPSGSSSSTPVLSTRESTQSECSPSRSAQPEKASPFSRSAARLWAYPSRRALRSWRSHRRTIYEHRLAGPALVVAKKQGSRRGVKTTVSDSQAARESGHRPARPLVLVLPGRALGVRRDPSFARSGRLRVASPGQARCTLEAWRCSEQNSNLVAAILFDKCSSPK